MSRKRNKKRAGQQPDSDAAAALCDDELIAPALWLAEAANALWRHARLGDINAQEAMESLSELLKAPVASFPIEPHLERALGLAMEIGHPICDCIYLAIALHHRTHVVTADRRFATAANLAGLDAQHQAFNYGAKIAGCTVHFVDEAVDHGVIILQKSVPVLDTDTPETLSARILEQEHIAYPEAIAQALSANYTIQNRRFLCKHD